MKTIIYLIRHAKPLSNKYILKNVEDNYQIINEKQVLSIEGEYQSYKLSLNSELKNIDLVISSNYVRAISTAKYIVAENRCAFYIDDNLGERKIGTEKKEKSFWLEQMLNENIKGIDGESQLEVRSRMLNVINDVLKNHKGKKVALVTHAAAMTFLLLNWCKLDDVKLEGKRRKISFNNEIIIDDSFNTPEVFKLVFEDDKIISINRIVLEDL